MAHEPVGQGPYPAVFAAVDEIPHPYIVFVKDPGGLYIVEDIADDRETLAQTACLFLQWVVDEMRQRYGAEDTERLLQAVAQGLGLNPR